MERGQVDESRNQRNPYGITAKTIQDDLSPGERPQWIMSCYGPGAETPIQLFGDYPLEQSPEEFRALYQQAIGTDNVQAYIQNEQELATAANGQVQNVLKDLDGAVQYLLNGEHEKGNRWDVIRESVPREVRHGLFYKDNPRRGRGNFGGQRQNERPVSGPSTVQAQGGNFGGTQSTGFGGAAFGGQTLGFGANAGGAAFGQSGFVQQNQGNANAPSNFGSLNQPGQHGFSNNMTAPGFGQQQQSNGLAGSAGFGVPAQPMRPSGFSGGGMQATPSSFGNQPALAPPPFGSVDQPVQQPVSTNFGQPPQPAFGTENNSSGFGAQNSSFGTQNNNAGFGAQQLPQNAFGSGFQSQPVNAFGQTQPQQTNGASNMPMGQPQAINQPQASNAFQVTPAPPQQQTNGFFGGATSQPPNTAQQNATVPTPNSTATNYTPDLSTYAKFDLQNNLTSWKGQPVVYDLGEAYARRPDGGLERIWFPHGVPGPDANLANGAGVTSGQDAEAWAFVRQHETFKDGAMPATPPGRSDLRWDL
ncbi:MAG: hypothetical protein M1828_003840 [Chrysothrix sp. TS-e1954]|nr:MAG: hypothetical protein M1828_003840 [Chrysothrix sp. TS-e1954]